MGLKLVRIGEDKPSPLLWTTWLQPMLRFMEEDTVHSRGDGLSSPCAPT